MYNIIYYTTKRGESPVDEYIKELGTKKDKDSRINLKKIKLYIELLQDEGLALGEPYIKPLRGEIWEIKPNDNRILFAWWSGKEFIILHHFRKSTKKTPVREIEQAERNLADYRERNK